MKLKKQNYKEYETNKLIEIIKKLEMELKIQENTIKNLNDKIKTFQNGDYIRVLGNVHELKILTVPDSFRTGQINKVTINVDLQLYIDLLSKLRIDNYRGY